MTSLDKREVILQAAEDLFAEYGFKGTSTRALADHAGVNLGMLTYYFGSKDKIFQAVIERRIGFFRGQLPIRLKQAKTHWDRIDIMIDLYLEHFLSNPKFFRIFSREMSINDGNPIKDWAMEMIVNNSKNFTRIFEDGIKDKAFRKVDVHMTLAAFIGTIMQFFNSERLNLKLIGQDPEIHSVTDKQNVKRLREFLRDFLHTYLKP